MRDSTARDRTAFTLLQLLAVIATAAMLFALLLPSLSGAKSKSKSTVCTNNLRQTGHALQMYVQDQESSYPNFSIDDPATATRVYWWAKLAPYYSLDWTNASYHCPGYRGTICSVGPLCPISLGSYGYNAMGVSFNGSVTFNGIHIPSNDTLGLGPPTTKSQPRPPVREATIVAPSQMLAIGESRFLDSSLNDRAGGTCEMVCGWIRSSKDVGPLAHFPEAFDEYRHGTKYNQVLCDGHVSSLSPWILFNPTNTASIWNIDHKPHPEQWIPD